METKESKNKELANWIYYEDSDLFYCSSCIENRVEEINSKKEFKEDINFEGGDSCGYMQDYADVDYSVNCCNCDKQLLSNIDLN